MVYAGHKTDKNLRNLAKMASFILHQYMNNLNTHIYLILSYVYLVALSIEIIQGRFHSSVCVRKRYQIWLWLHIWKLNNAYYFQLTYIIQIFSLLLLGILLSGLGTGLALLLLLLFCIVPNEVGGGIGILWSACTDFALDNFDSGRGRGLISSIEWFLFPARPEKTVSTDNKNLQDRWYQWSTRPEPQPCQ